MTAEAGRALVEALAAVPGRARQAAQAASGRAPAEGEWAPHTVIAHLAHVEAEVWQARFRQMAEEDDPRWQRWEAGPGWETGFGHLSLDEVLDLFAGRRGETVAHLSGLTAPGWGRRGQHATFGLLDVAGLCGRMLEHDEEHLQQLGRLA